MNAFRSSSVVNSLTVWKWGRLGMKSGMRCSSTSHFTKSITTKWLWRTKYWLRSLHQWSKRLPTTSAASWFRSTQAQAPCSNQKTRKLTSRSSFTWPMRSGIILWRLLGSATYLSWRSLSWHRVKFLWSILSETLSCRVTKRWKVIRKSGSKLHKLMMMRVSWYLIQSIKRKEWSLALIATS